MSRSFFTNQKFKLNKRVKWNNKEETWKEQMYQWKTVLTIRRFLHGRATNPVASYFVKNGGFAFWCLWEIIGKNLSSKGNPFSLIFGTTLIDLNSHKKSVLMEHFWRVVETGITECLFMFWIRKVILSGINRNLVRRNKRRLRSHEHVS